MISPKVLQTDEAKLSHLKKKILLWKGTNKCIWICKLTLILQCYISKRHIIRVHTLHTHLFILKKKNLLEDEAKKRWGSCAVLFNSDNDEVH